MPPIRLGTLRIPPTPGALAQQAGVGFFDHGIVEDQGAARHGKPDAQGQVQACRPGPGALKQPGQTVVGSVFEPCKMGRLLILDLIFIEYEQTICTLVVST
jgi:hypothetical protein